MANTAITPLNFAEWAHAASRDYIANGTLMNTSIVKVARENELSPMQIQRVCEIANHHAYSELFKSAEDKTFDFPLASTEEIMEALKEEPEKVAADYILDPVGSKREIDSNRVFGVSEIGNEPEIEERQKLARKALEKIAAAKEEISGMSVFNHEEIVGLEDEFYKIAKQMVLEGTSLRDIRAACQGSWDSPRAEELIVKTAMKMAREGVLGAKLEYLMKTSEAVDAALISDKLAKNNAGVPVRVINGNHPIVSTINTLNDKYKDADNMEQSLEVLDDKARMVRSKMEDLNTSKKVDQYIQKEVS